MISFAYPFGSFGPETAGVVEQAGISLAFDAFVPPLELNQIDRLHVPRQMVEGGISLLEFAALLNTE